MLKNLILFAALTSVFACQGGCNIEDITDKAAEYKDKIDPEQAKEALDKAKKSID